MVKRQKWPFFNFSARHQLIFQRKKAHSLCDIGCTIIMELYTNKDDFKGNNNPKSDRSPISLMAICLFLSSSVLLGLGALYWF